MPRRRRIALERRGNGYRARFQIGKERHSITVPTSDRRVAVSLAEKRVGELEREAERKLAGMVTGVRMSELFAKFERDEMPVLSRGTTAAYVDSMKPIKRYFAEIGDPTVGAVQARHIKDYLAWRRINRLVPAKQKGEDAPAPAPLSNRTLQKDRAVLHRIFALAEKHEYREGNPVARSDRPKADPRDPVILSDEQFENLLAACDGRPMLRLYVLILGETGMRCKSEAAWLRWEDVRLDEGSIRVTSGRNGHRTKAGKSRFVPMTPRLAAAIREHFARYRFAQYGGAPTPWLLHHETTLRHHAAGERIGSLHSAFQSAAQRAKLPPGLHQHDLRHRRVTTWLGAGKSPVAVMHALGHADLKTTMSYYQFVPDHLRALVTDDLSPTRHEAVAAS